MDYFPHHDPSGVFVRFTQTNQCNSECIFRALHVCGRNLFGLVAFIQRCRTVRPIVSKAFGDGWAIDQSNRRNQLNVSVQRVDRRVKLGEPTPSVNPLLPNMATDVERFPPPSRRPTGTSTTEVSSTNVLNSHLAHRALGPEIGAASVEPFVPRSQHTGNQRSARLVCVCVFIWKR